MPYDLQTPLKALRLAVDLLESYQSDMRHSEWTGVDLRAVGFCQRILYLHGVHALKEALARFDRELTEEDGDSPSSPLGARALSIRRSAGCS